MASSFLAALLELLLAAFGIWSSLPEVRGRPVKLWRLGLPALCATIMAIMVFATSADGHGSVLQWGAAAVLGAATGALVGNRAGIETDQIWGLIRLRPAWAGLIAAGVILAIAVIEAATAMAGMALVPANRDPAIAVALLAGLVDGRAWTVAVRAIRAPHVELHDL